MRRASCSKAPMSLGERCSMLSSEPRAGVFMRKGPRRRARPGCVLTHFLDEKDFFRVVGFLELHFHDLVVLGLDSAAYERGLDGKLAMAAVNQDAKLHEAWAPVGEQGVHGGAYGAAGVEDVIDQDHDFASNGDAQVGLLDHRFRSQRGEVVAIEADVEGCDRNL